MKIYPINPSINFQKKDHFEKEFKEKAHTTLKLAIGTAVVGAASLAAYYLIKRPDKTKEVVETASKTITK